MGATIVVVWYWHGINPESGAVKMNVVMVSPVLQVAYVADPCHELSNVMMCAVMMRHVLQMTSQPTATCGMWVSSSPGWPPTLEIQVRVTQLILLVLVLLALPAQVGS
jgi:hypothetical protein